MPRLDHATMSVVCNHGYTSIAVGSGACSRAQGVHAIKSRARAGSGGARAQVLPEPSAESRRSPSRTRDDWAGQAEDPARRERVAPPKKKKQGLMDFIKESIQRALEDDEDDYEDDLEPFQLDKTYDKKRK